MAQRPHHTGADLLIPSRNATDSRSSSTHSLVPPEWPETDGRRKLLLIYVHGFMGDETSFQHFPAHVHHCLTNSLRESHAVHTKVYPKYKTRHKVQEVREIFSNWLAPHESLDQDIILLGHSMGGILTAEVVLQPSYALGSVTRFRHRILGTVNFDVPFLGMHYGVVGSGLGSLVKPVPKLSRSPSPTDRLPAHPLQTNVSNDERESIDIPQMEESSLTSLQAPGDDISRVTSANSTSLSLPTSDPNFDPAFTNDVVLKKRTGWANARHFIQKHSHDLLHASESLVTSYLEFGGAMADYRALKRRYDRVRALDDRRARPRVRFVNYYTACTGRVKRERQPKARQVSKGQASELSCEMKGLDIEPESASHTSSRVETSLNILESVQSEKVGRGRQSDLDEITSGQNSSIKFSKDKTLSATEEVLRPSYAPQSLVHEGKAMYDNPQHSKEVLIPDVPCKPDEEEPQMTRQELPNLGFTAEAEAIHATQIPYEQRVERLASSKVREPAGASEKPSAIRKNVSGIEAPTKENEDYIAQQKSATDPATQSKADNTVGTSKDDRQKKPKKDRKFCLLPSKINGEQDPCWVKVFMADVDEVGAHCGLFSMEEDPERYELFVEDISLRIVDWVSEG